MVAAVLDVVSYLETKIPTDVKNIDDKLYKEVHELNLNGAEEDLMSGKWFTDVVDSYKPSKDLIGVGSAYLSEHNGVLEGCQEIPKLSQRILKYLEFLNKEYEYYEDISNIIDFKNTRATAFDSTTYPNQTRWMSKTIENLCYDTNNLSSYVEKMHFILICAVEWMEQSVS